MDFSVRNGQESVLWGSCEGGVTTAKTRWRFCQNYTPKNAKINTKKYQSPAFWEVLASPVCWLKTERKNKVHVRGLVIKQPPRFLFALMAPHGGDNKISEKFPAYQIPGISRWSWTGSPIPRAARRIKTLFPGPSCLVGATTGTFWISILDSTGIHWGTASPCKWLFLCSGQSLSPSCCFFQAVVLMIFPLGISGSQPAEASMKCFGFSATEM